MELKRDDLAGGRNVDPQIALKYRNAVPLLAKPQELVGSGLVFGHQFEIVGPGRIKIQQIGIGGDEGPRYRMRVARIGLGERRRVTSETLKTSGIIQGSLDSGTQAAGRALEQLDGPGGAGTVVSSLRFIATNVDGFFCRENWSRQPETEQEQETASQ